MTLAEEVIAALETPLKVADLTVGDRVRHSWLGRNGTVILVDTRAASHLQFAHVLLDGDNIPHLFIDANINYTRVW